MMNNDFWKSKLPLLEVLLILVIIIVVFTSYGLAEKAFSVKTDIKQADVKSLFERDSSGTGSKIDSLLMAAEGMNDAVVDTTSKYILLCGDSMTEQMRFALDEYAKKNGHKLMTCTWYSSTTVVWSESKRLTTLIKEYKPDIILFTLGSNELFLPAVAKREKNIQDIIAEADAFKIPFIWISPPNWKDDSGITQLIEKKIGKKRFFNSSYFRERLARISDGAHPTKAAAAIWADSIVNWYRTESVYKNKLSLNFSKDTLPFRPYKPAKEVCAPARDNRWGVRVLKADEPAVLCKDDQPIQQPQNSTNNNNVILIPGKEAEIIDSNRQNNPLTK